MKITCSAEKVRRAKRSRHANDHERDWRRETEEAAALVSRVFAAQRSRDRELPLLNLKKKKAYSQSMEKERFSGPRLRILTSNRYNKPQYTGKNNRFPFLDILGYLKNTHKNTKFGRVRQVPIRELGWEFPDWDLSHFAKFGIFMGIL